MFESLVEEKVNEMKICVIGCGFVGLSTGAVLSHLNHEIHLVESDNKRLSMIRNGKPPFFEPGLERMLSEGIRKNRIKMGDDIGKATKVTDFIFIAVQTPPGKDGSLDLKFLRNCVNEIGKQDINEKTVVIKSTVPPGTTRRVVIPILEEASGLKAGKDFGIAMNPEFLQEGRAIEDSLHPSRIVVGGFTARDGVGVMKIFRKIDAPKMIVDINTAELIKLISNCFLSTKISYSNEIAEMCEYLDADVKDVMRGVGLDPRIGASFLNAGLGFGGSCLPKDLNSTINVAKSLRLNPRLLLAVKEINDNQPSRAIEMLEEELKNLSGKRIAILGLAFKAGVDDVRDSRAIPLAMALLDKGAQVIGYDPKAQNAFQERLPMIKCASSLKEALKNADGCIIQTEEKEFSDLKKEAIDGMRKKIVIDGRRVLEPTKALKYGIRLRAIGRQK